MAVVATLSNHFKYMLATGKVDFSSGGNVYKLILMNNTFAFDKDAHATLADVTADQLGTGSGYTQDNEVLANVAVTEDDANDKAYVTWDDATFTASGGSIGPTGAYIVYDDTTTDDTVVGCVDYGTDFTIPDESSFQCQNIQFDLT